MRVAVVGAGVAGLACARVLAEHGVDVTVFDKGGSVGGRLSTTWLPRDRFDLGAQYFTTRDPRFAQQVASWRAAGVCAPWNGRIVAIREVGGSLDAVDSVERLVGTPDMTALARHMATGLRVYTSHRVDRIARRDGRLELSGTTGAGETLPAHGYVGGEDLGCYDAVVLCLPSNQAAMLLAGVSPSLAEAARGAPLEPCFAMGFVAGAADEEALHALAFDGAFLGREAAPMSALSWIARDSSKPGRAAGERWVLHAWAAWSRANFDMPKSDVAAYLIAELARLFALRPLRPALEWVRRWSFARAPTPLECGALFDEETQIGVGGDWAAGGRIEGAFLSGIELAARVITLDRA